MTAKKANGKKIIDNFIRNNSNKLDEIKLKNRNNETLTEKVKLCIKVSTKDIPENINYHILSKDYKKLTSIITDDKDYSTHYFLKTSYNGNNYQQEITKDQYQILDGIHLIECTAKFISKYGEITATTRTSTGLEQKLQYRISTEKIIKELDLTDIKVLDKNKKTYNKNKIYQKNN